MTLRGTAYMRMPMHGSTWSILPCMLEHICKSAMGLSCQSTTCLRRHMISPLNCWMSASAQARHSPACTSTLPYRCDAVEHAFVWPALSCTYTFLLAQQGQHIQAPQHSFSGHVCVNRVLFQGIWCYILPGMVLMQHKHRQHSNHNSHGRAAQCKPGPL